jgi:hypothetical protein
MSSTNLFFLFCLIFACSSLETIHVPTLMWSGAKTSHLPGKYLHDSVCSINEVKAEVLNVMSSKPSTLFTKAPKFILAFVHENVKKINFC